MRWFAVLLLAAAAVRTASADMPPKNDSHTIQHWIESLGSSSFAQRERATRALEDIGPPALEAVRKATHSSDSEVRNRATRLLPRISLLADTQEVLRPTRVHLKYQQTPLAAAVADFARQSGYSMALDNDDTGTLTGRKMTLDTGETTFWQAYDQFCRVAALVEVPRRGKSNFRRSQTYVPRRDFGSALVLASGDEPSGAAARQVLGKEPSKKPPSAVKRKQPAVMFLFGPGKPADLPTCYDGALRIQVRSITRDAENDARNIRVNLTIAVEPKIGWRNVSGADVETAVDDRGQRLAQLGVRGDVRSDLSAPSAPDTFPILPEGDPYRPALYLRLGTERARRLRDLKFSVYGSVRERSAKLGYWGPGSQRPVLLRLSLHHVPLP